MEFEYLFHWPLSYPQALLDSVEEELEPVIKEWACGTFEALQRQFLSYPKRGTMISLQGMGTSQQIAGEPVCAFLAMSLHRKAIKPEIVCFIGSKEALEAERDRIVAEVQTESIARKSLPLSPKIIVMPDLERARVEKDAPGPDGTGPALRGLAKLSDLRPIIAIDTREQSPLKFTRLEAVERALFTGDYSIIGLEEEFAVERKSLDDLANCCLSSNRNRFEHELHRLRGYRFRRLLIVGTRAEIETQRYHSRIAPKSVLGTVAAFEVRYDLPVVFCSSPEEAATAIERWAVYYCREVLKLAHTFSTSLRQPQK
jgi:hypothetical protein